MTEELVLYESQDKIGLVTLNRPQKLNALSRDMRPALSAALRRADEDAATSVVVLRCAAPGVPSASATILADRAAPTRPGATTR